jgi:hypothetical protein
MQESLQPGEWLAVALAAAGTMGLGATSEEAPKGSAISVVRAVAVVSVLVITLGKLLLSQPSCTWSAAALLSGMDVYSIPRFRCHCWPCRCFVSAAACSAAAAAGAGSTTNAGPHHSLRVWLASGRLLRVVSRLLPHGFPAGGAAAAVCPSWPCRQRGLDVRGFCAADVRPQGRQQPRGGCALGIESVMVCS